MRAFYVIGTLGFEERRNGRLVDEVIVACKPESETYLLSDHVHHVLNPAIRDNGEYRRINNPQPLDTMNLQLPINDPLCDIPRQPIRATGMKTRLTAFQDGSIHRQIRCPRHRPGIVFAYEILHAVTIHDDIVDEADAFAHDDEVEIVGEEVKVDVWLHRVIGRAETDFPAGREGAQKVDDDGEMVTLRWSWDVPLEGISKHRLEIREET